MTKGPRQEAKLSFSANALMENRHGLLVDFAVGIADGFAERREALRMIDRQLEKGICPKTLGEDKAYDIEEHVADLRDRGVTPHVAQNVTKFRGSKIDRRTTRHPGYEISQQKRKLVEEAFGWMKSVAGWRKTRYRGVRRNELWGYILAAAYNLTRIPKLAALEGAS